MNEPTTSQLQAVVNFSRRHGKDWKERLRDRWHYGIDFREIDGALLQQVRNEFGPEWLNQQPEVYPK